MPAGVRGWNNGMSWERKVGGDLCDPLGDHCGFSVTELQMVLGVLDL